MLVRNQEVGRLWCLVAFIGVFVRDVDLPVLLTRLNVWSQSGISDYVVPLLLAVPLSALALL